MSPENDHADNRSLDSSLGDLAHLAGLIEEYRDRLLEMIRRRLPPVLASRLDAEEVLSEAFLLAQRRYSQFQQQGQMTPYAWLYRIVLDCLIEAWRRETRGKRDVQRDLPWPKSSALDLGAALIDTGTSPSEALDREEIRRRMRQALDSLRAKDQEILWMRTHDQLSFKEIASLLDTTVKAASNRYVRALRRLRTAWQHLDRGGPSKSE